MTKSMPVDVKICGVKTPEIAQVATDEGARYLGFMFFEPSPRHLTNDAAAKLGRELPNGPDRVGVFVNPTDEQIDAAITALGLNWLQLHGAETPERLDALKNRFGLNIIKAVGVRSVEDIISKQHYYTAADMMLFDAKPPEGAILPGGNAISFPWEILNHAPLPQTWMLAGGLTPENVPDAVKVSQAKILDVSSGVETSPGVKSQSKIEAFLRAAKAVR